jgi:hypothetical protein
MSSAWSRGPQQWRWAAAVGTHAGGGLSCFVWITRKGKSEKGGSIAAWGSYIGPAVDEQEVAAAGGAGSPRQEEGDVARGEGDNGEEVGRWKTLRRRVGLHSGWGWSSGTAPARGGGSRSRAERKRG